MASKRKTVDNDDLTIVVKETVFGMASRYELVKDWDYPGGGTVLLRSDNNLDKDELRVRAEVLAKKLNIPVVVE